MLAKEFILQSMKKNSHINLFDIAEEMKSSQGSVRKHISRLKKDGHKIMRFLDEHGLSCYALFDESKCLNIKKRDKKYSVRKRDDGVYPAYHFKLGNGERINIGWLGDAHIKSKFEYDFADYLLDMYRKKGMYVAISGDMFEMATRYSVGSGVYNQEYNGHKQFEKVAELMERYQDIILFVTDGNHENRVVKEVGVSLMKIICDTLDITYSSGRLYAYVDNGKSTKLIHATHNPGSSAQTTQGKIKAIHKRVLDHFPTVDFVLAGHLHFGACESSCLYRLTMSIKNLKPEFVNRYAIMNPSLLRFYGGYGDQKGMTPIPFRIFSLYINNENDYGVYEMNIDKKEIEKKFPGIMVIK